MKFDSPEALLKYTLSLVEQLRSEGLADQASILESSTTMVCTTGWEWLGELGLGVEKVQSMGAYSKDTSKNRSIIRKTTRSKKPYG